MIHFSYKPKHKRIFVMEETKKTTGFNGKQFVIWMAALIIGAVLGLLKVEWLNEFFNFIATVYTKQ